METYRVDFPAPLGPSKANIVSSDTPKLTSSTTRLEAVPKAFMMFITLSESVELETLAASSWTSFLVVVDTGFSELVKPPLNCENLRTITEPESTQTRIPNKTKP